MCSSDLLRTGRVPLSELLVRAEVVDAGGFDGIHGWAGHLLLEFVQVSYSQLQNVSFLQAGHVLSFRLQANDKDLLQLIERSIDAGTALAFEQRLCNLKVKESIRKSSAIASILKSE